MERNDEDGSGSGSGSGKKDGDDAALHVLAMLEQQCASFETLAEKMRRRVMQIVGEDEAAYASLCASLENVLAHGHSGAHRRGGTEEDEEKHDSGGDEDEGYEEYEDEDEHEKEKLMQALYSRATKLCGGPEEAQQAIFCIQKIFAAEAGLRECQADRALLSKQNGRAPAE